MSISKQILSVEDLKVGMVSVNDIKFDGRVLVGKNVPLTETIIKRLKNSYLYQRIEVYFETQDTTEETNSSFKTVNEVNATLDELSNNLNDLFDNIETLKATGIDELRKFAIDIENELESTHALVKSIILNGSKSDTIYRHSVNVAAISSILGKWLELPGDQIKLLTYSALLHDFGKTKINQNILNKPGPLTKEELAQIKLHTVSAYNLVKEIPFLDKAVSYGVLMHHERLDGSGYPLGLKDNNIHTFGKIIAIADTFDAINSDRPYKISSTPINALITLQQESLHRLDYHYCKVFLEHLLNYYTGENVLLNTNAVCKILNLNINDLSNPLLLSGSDLIDFRHHKNLQIQKIL